MIVKLNYKIIVHFLGLLLLVNGGFMLLASLLSYFYDDGAAMDIFKAGLVVLVCFTHEPENVVESPKGVIATILRGNPTTTYPYLCEWLGRNSLDVVGTLLCAAAGFWAAKAFGFPDREHRQKLLQVYGPKVIHLGFTGMACFVVRPFFSLFLDGKSTEFCLIIAILQLVCLGWVLYWLGNRFHTGGSTQ